MTASATTATWKLKFATLGVFAILYVFTYIIPNFFPITKVNFLPLTWVDSNIPLVPSTFIIYLSDYVLGLSIFAAVLDKRDYLVYTIRMYICLILCGISFWFFPTIYPRPVYPDVSFPLTKLLMYLVRNLDSPTNCFPSQHVALTWACFSCMPWKKASTKAAYFVWSIAICVSTLTTKQHYLVDIFGGSAIALLCIPLEKTITSKFLKNMVMVSHASDAYRTGTFSRSDRR